MPPVPVGHAPLPVGLKTRGYVGRWVRRPAPPASTPHQSAPRRRTATPT